jgi:hypothetical protein
MKAKATAVSRRQMLASVPAADALSPTTAEASDPVFAAIRRHRQAVQSRIPEHDEDAAGKLLDAESDALLVWLTTPPTTMAGVLATLDHASARQPWPACWRPDDHDGCTNLLESADCDHEWFAAIEQFPAMIATALRQIMAEKSL